MSTNYVFVEALAVASRRLGMAAVNDLCSDLMAPIDLIWVERDAHVRATSAYLAARRRDLSLVDCVSFEVMRALGIRDAFAFDPHFAEFGFRPIP